MANLGFLFNPADHKPFGDFTLTPKGEWNAIISKSEIDQSDANEPKLVLTFQIFEGSEKGTELHENLFLWTPKDGSKSGGKGDISRRKMTTINNAIGQFEQYQDTAILHNRPLTIKTDIRYSLKNDGSGQYIGFPDIKSFKTCVGAGQAAGADPVQPQAPGAAAPASNAPSLPTAPSFGGGMPAAPSFAPPAAPAPAGFPAAPTGYAPAPVQAGAFAPPMAPAQQFPGAPQQQQFAPPMGQAPAPFAPPVPGAPAPFAMPPR